jgi:hypothetical protein
MRRVCASGEAVSGLVMQSTRYWGLFWIAAGLSVHAVLVGRQLESSFFVMLFFWGFVAFSALRGSLEAAQSMAVVMVLLLGALAAATLTGGAEAPSLAYATFALYPALVSWISVFFYIRHLRHAGTGEPERRPALWRQRRAG